LICNRKADRNIQVFQGIYTLDYNTVSGVLLFFKQQSPQKIFKPWLVRTVYHRKRPPSSICGREVIEKFINIW